MSLDRLSHYQFHLYLKFFDEVEDRAVAICEKLAMNQVLIDEGASEKLVKRLYRKSLEMFEGFEQFGKDQREFLKGEGIPYTLINPVIIHAVTRIKITASQYLRPPRGEA